MLRRKRYSKRPGRGKASSFPSTSEVQVEVTRQQIGGPSSKTMLHESRAAFLASQSSTRLNSRSTLLSERPAKVHYLVSFLKDFAFINSLVWILGHKYLDLTVLKVIQMHFFIILSRILFVLDGGICWEHCVRKPRKNFELDKRPR